MRILVVSDTHRKNDGYMELLTRHRPEMVIHCGDSEGSEYALTYAADCPVQMVMGNCDYFTDLPGEVEMTLEGHRIWITHGHNYRVNMGTELLKQEARSRGVDIVFFGHTHKPMVAAGDDVTVVNPGSLSYPRQEGRKPSYIILELTAGAAEFEIRYLEQE